jgi:hypothetical protein
MHVPPSWPDLRAQTSDEEAASAARRRNKRRGTILPLEPPHSRSSRRRRRRLVACLRAQVWPRGPHVHRLRQASQERGATRNRGREPGARAMASGLAWQRPSGLSGTPRLVAHIKQGTGRIWTCPLRWCAAHARKRQRACRQSALLPRQQAATNPRVLAPSPCSTPTCPAPAAEPACQARQARHLSTRTWRLSARPRSSLAPS